MSLGTEGKRRYYVTWDHWDFTICTIPPLENLWLCSNTFVSMDVLVPICLQSLDMGFSIFQTQEDLLVSSNNQKGKMPLMTLTLSNYPYSAGMHYKISTLADYTTILSYISISLKFECDCFVATAFKLSYLGLRLWIHSRTMPWTLLRKEHKTFKDCLIQVKTVLSLAICIIWMEENMCDCKTVFLQEKYCEFLFFLRNVTKVMFLRNFHWNKS